MKNKIHSSLCAAVVASFLLTSCTVYTERDKLREQNDSLKIAHVQLESEINSYFETLNDISDNLNKVKQIEGIITMPSSDGISQDLSLDINNSISTISDIIKDNNAKIAELTKKMKNSSVKIKQLEKNLVKLTSENERLAAEITSLQSQLLSRDQTIASQNLSIAALSDSAAVLSRKVTAATSLANEQDEQLHTAWYVFGTTRELRAQGIIGKSGLSSRSLLKGEFNQDYFVKVDTRNVTEIPLYSKKAKLLTTHPDGSYTLEKQDGLYTLTITQPQQFWSVSNYMVIDID